MATRSSSSNSDQESATRGRGRPAIGRDETLATRIRVYVAMGVPQLEICRLVGFSEGSLRKYYAPELDDGHIEANARVAQSLFKMATHTTKPSAAAAIFWLKCRAGWKENAAPGEDPPMPPMGKKEAQELLARVAHKGTSWDKLLK